MANLRPKQYKLNLSYLEPMKRNRSMDVFRGLAIVGMVFFTLTLRLSSDLPDILRHNISGTLHLGDFVLPMFIFGSGISLAYYISKRKVMENNIFVRNVLERFGLLALVGIILSPFSTRGFLEMDEVMLIALLFLACIVLYGLDWKILMGIVFFIDLAYLLFIQPGWLLAVDPFTGYYLGGYAAAPFYLTIMIVGLIIGQGIVSDKLWCIRNILTMVLASIFFLFTWIFVSIDKLAVSPSFMMLAILFCFAIYAMMDRIVKNMQTSNELEYLGRKPIRYWIMMYVLVLIPLILYAEYSGNQPLDLHWPLGIMVSICVMLLLWLVSKSIDLVRDE